MPIYSYIGRNVQGKEVRGKAEATSCGTVADLLNSMDITPLEINEDPEALNLSRFLNAKRNRRVKSTDLVFFSSQMSTLIRAGVPVVLACETLLQTRGSVVLGDMIRKIRDCLKEGQDLSAAMANYPDVFSRMYVAMIKIGETTGTLAETFNAMANFIAREKAISDEVKTATRYPLIVLGGIVLAVVILNAFVFPQIAEIYSQFKAQLPLTTRGLLATSTMVQNYWFIPLGAAVALSYWANGYLRTQIGRYKWDRLLLSLPLVGPILLWSILAVFLRSLAVTGKSGLPILQAMPIIAPVVNNTYVEQRLIAMTNSLESGQSFSQAAEKAQLFTPLVMQIFRVGEDTGEMENLMTEAADFYEREVEYNVKKLRTFMELVLIAIVAMILFVLMLGVFDPMFGIIDAVRYAY